ncbi:MAG: glycine cleavage system protein GcvH [Firmicutes bacterium]|nr:glycine cleavage system protein GcvH [Bacillota bacterium]
MTFPEKLRYTETHEWSEVKGDTGTMGITDKAQDLMGDIVFVELPEIGEKLTAGEPFGDLESIKTVAEMYAPFSGTVIAVNEVLRDRPTILNEDPYGNWILRVQDPEEGELMSAEEYIRFIDAQ